MPPLLNCPSCQRWSQRIQWRNVSLFVIRCPACRAEHDVSEPEFKLHVPGAADARSSRPA